MNKTTEIKKASASSLFTLANRIKKERNVSQKEAFAIAKELLASAPKDEAPVAPVIVDAPDSVPAQTPEPTAATEVDEAPVAQDVEDTATTDAAPVETQEPTAVAVPAPEPAPVESPVSVAAAVKPATKSLADELEACLKAGNVNFTFKNGKGQTITTTGTMREAAVPTTRKVDGKKDARHSDMRVFYDVRHGIYRQYDINNVVAINVPSVVRGRVKKVAAVEVVAK